MTLKSLSYFVDCLLAGEIPSTRKKILCQLFNFFKRLRSCPLGEVRLLANVLGKTMGVEPTPSVHLWSLDSRRCTLAKGSRGGQLEAAGTAQGHGFPQKCVTCNIQNFEKDWMICNIIVEITRNQEHLDIFKHQIEYYRSHHAMAIYRIQADIFHELDSNSAFILCNPKIFLEPMVAWLRLFACLAW